MGSFGKSVGSFVEPVGKRKNVFDFALDVLEEILMIFIRILDIFKPFLIYFLTSNLKCLLQNRRFFIRI